LIGLLLLGACGSNNRKGPPASEQVDFAFELKGETHRIAELRGRPLVLVLMRTSSLASQLYMTEVSKAFSRIAGRTRFLVLSIEPHELPFVEPYAEFEKLPFSIGVAERAVSLGQTPLGVIPVIPTTYLISSQGRVMDAAAGSVKAEEIVRAAASLGEN
jgi:hypothetical protein